MVICSFSGFRCQCSVLPIFIFVCCAYGFGITSMWLPPSILIFIFLCSLVVGWVSCIVSVLSGFGCMYSGRPFCRFSIFTNILGITIVTLLCEFIIFVLSSIVIMCCLFVSGGI